MDYSSNLEDWMRAVNMTAHPELSHLCVTRYLINGSYAGHVHSGSGSFLSPFFKEAKDLEEWIDGTNKTVENLKESYEAIKKPSLELL